MIRSCVRSPDVNGSEPRVREPLYRGSPLDAIEPLNIASRFRSKRLIIRAPSREETMRVANLFGSTPLLTSRRSMLSLITDEEIRTLAECFPRSFTENEISIVGFDPTSAGKT